MSTDPKNHNPHFCMAEFNDFIMTISLLDMEPSKREDTFSMYLDRFKSYVLLDEKVYYSNLWFNFLKNEFPVFLELPTNIHDRYLHFKIKNYTNVCTYRIYSQKTSKTTELANYILKNEITFSKEFIEKIKILSQNLNFKIKINTVDGYIRISTLIPDIAKTYEFFLDFIDKLHYPIFSAYCLEEIKQAKDLSERERRIKKAIDHSILISEFEHKKLLSAIELL